MSNFQPVSTKIEKLTHSKCREYLALPVFEGERDINERHVADLVSAMRTDRFRGGHIATVDVNGKTHKLNGQHQCTAFMQLNGDAPEVKATFEHYHVKNPQEFAELYMTFDKPICTRTWAHIVRIYAATNPKYGNFSSRLLGLCCAAIGFHKAGSNNRHTINREDRVKLLDGYPLECAAIAKIVENPKDSRHLIREPVVAAMFKTILKSRASALQFWGMVRDGANLDKEHPAKLLERYLTSVNSAKGVGARGGRKTAGFPEMYSKCIHAWNAWRRNGTTDLKFYSNADLPEAK